MMGGLGSVIVIAFKIPTSSLLLPAKFDWRLELRGEQVVELVAEVA